MSGKIVSCHVDQILCQFINKVWAKFIFPLMCVAFPLKIRLCSKKFDADKLSFLNSEFFLHSIYLIQMLWYHLTTFDIISNILIKHESIRCSIMIKNTSKTIIISDMSKGLRYHLWYMSHLFSTFFVFVYYISKRVLFNVTVQIWNLLICKKEKTGFRQCLLLVLGRNVYETININ